MTPKAIIGDDDAAALDDALAPITERPNPTATRRTRGRRKAGAASSVNVDAATADRIELLQRHYQEEHGFPFDRSQIVHKAIVELLASEGITVGEAKT